MDVKLITQIKHMQRLEKVYTKSKKYHYPKKKKKKTVYYVDYAKGVYFRGLVQQLDYFSLDVRPSRQLTYYTCMLYVSSVS